MASSIVTRKGDDGTTAMLYGQRVAKDHPQIEALGAFDELNAAIGFAKALCADAPRRVELEAIQNALISVMGELACAEVDVERYAASKFAKLGDADLERVDAGVTMLEAKKLPMDGWATPGLTMPGAAFDLARTAARRAERRLVTIASHGRTIRPVITRYANRIGDLFWLMARDAEQVK